MAEAQKDVTELEKELRRIRWRQPGRNELILVLLYIFSWYLFNDMFNLISIEGLSATGHFFNGLDIMAFIPLALSFVVMISVLVTFTIRSTFDKLSHKDLNTFVGIWIFFGVLLMVVALTLMLEGFPPNYNIEWLLNLSRNSVYHIGVFLFQIPGIVYFALFK